MSEKIDFGVMDLSQANDALGAAKLAESLGFHSVWVGDHVLWHVPMPDSFVQLAAFGTVTTIVGLGTAVYLAPLRTPAAVAKQAATLDLISGGRFIFGVGVGGENPLEYEASGIPMNQRGRRLDEMIQICRLLWTGERVTYQGKLFRFGETQMDIRPARPGGPPIWIGGRSEGAMRRTGRLGDGWLPYAITAERYSDGWRQVQEHAERADRDPRSIRPAMHALCQLASTTEEARASISTTIEATYRVPYEKFERFTLSGTPKEWLHWLQRYVEAGARHFNLVFAGGDLRKQMVQFKEEVLPHVSSLL